MKLVIFGATGFSGKAILAEALSQCHQVAILVRNKNRITVSQDSLKVIEGDALDRHAIARALEGCDAVIQCLGVGGKGDGKPTTFISESTRIITEEMQRQGIERFIALSNVGAGNSKAFLPAFFRIFILPVFMKWLQVIIDDKNRMESIIMNSGLDWTIVRCPNIVDKPGRGVFLATLDGKRLKWNITREDLAEFIINQLYSDLYIRQTPAVSN